MKKSYSFKATIWLYPGETANWHFVTVPKALAAEIKALYGTRAKGFGSLPVSVTIHEVTWCTSIFPDRRSGTYLLPIKAKVRRQADLYLDDEVDIALTLV